MSIEPVPGTDLKYYLISYDKNGDERTDDPDGMMSEKIVNALTSEAVTDLFIISHGWKGDVVAAKDQYGKWIGVMAKQQADIDRMRQKRPGFRALLVGFHWPSLPWGDEELGGSSFSPASMPTIDEMVESYAERIADTADARQALRTILESAARNINPPKMPEEVSQAYRLLNEEADMGSEGEGAAPGDDREPFDPEFTFEAVRQEQLLSFGGTTFGGILSPLRQLSFWKMKDRARTVGENGGADFLKEILDNSGPPRDVKIHLVGHSFGCVVASAILTKSALSRPVDSVTLLQGALSLWSYCVDIPKAPGKPGYFHSMVGGDKVKGPVITTQSVFDAAVGNLYPIAAGVARQVSFVPNELPKYGAVGAFGARGPGLEVIDQKMLPPDCDYAFQGGRVYNLESSQFICEGSGLSGAHSDIAKPEVAHAVWQAAMV